MIAVARLGDAVDEARWDEFVATCPQATFFHRSGWRNVIGDVFGHETYFLYAEKGGRIAGVLPLAYVNSRLFGRRLAALPFCVYGGVAAEDDSTRDALVARAGQIGRELQVDFIEFRNLHPQPGLPASDRYVTFRKPLDPDPAANLAAVPRKQRAMIRKGAQKGLVVRKNAPIDDFFRVYAESLRDLGTPVLPLRYFCALQHAFGDACEVMTVAGPDGGQPLAAVLSFYFRDEVLPYYGGGTPAARQFHAYDFMYWELMVHALGRGVRWYDFGRSRRGTGSYRFKTHWGFEPQPLHYQYDLVRSSAVPNVSPDNPRYRTLIGAWQKLPLWVTTTVGPWLARDLG